MTARDLLADVDYELPPARIAQRPAERRVGSRLLCWHDDGRLVDRRFEQIESLFHEGDLLVLNDTKVFAARLFGTKSSGSARVEILLVRPRSDLGAIVWEALVKPGRRLPPGTRVDLEGEQCVIVRERTDHGTCLVEFDQADVVFDHCRRHGHVPLPPYIARDDDASDRGRYQTVFARREGSVAAPTAGLHFDDPLLGRLSAGGVQTAKVTLHVGPGTFRPLEPDDLDRGELHAEWREVSEATAEALETTRARGGRIIAVGTTVCRTLESLGPEAAPTAGLTRLFLRPGDPIHWTDVLITNFHLPRSSLLLLVATLAPGRWRSAYEHAIANGYRFYSYGDANWIERAT